ncbi:polyprenyl synthetase family protein [Bartonella sp. TP]|uniref:polyprenyl synthetase family protein n=1 Tax=Bartonella sp. TP TaxID=3057550 RepID=UPI0025AFC1BD|nr:farnesyl diphosphate synthase [Bartonella sp. TP]WJW79573.1 polyprenyl synthetase family protein [Bartonella sp. TP]
MLTFHTQLQNYANRIDAGLKEILTHNVQKFELARPQKLLAAMRYALLNKGKRLRSFLLLKTTELLNGNESAALHVACAIEVVHCYSLIHDDLPAMDDDDLRRGQPTVHKKFDEATAILAGDALLTLAFDILATPQAGLSPASQLQLILELSRASGLGGMVGGQILDLANENKIANEQEILLTHAMKTGALFNFSAKAGAIISQASEEEVAIIEAFGSAIGLAFQLADDVLDLTSTSQSLGKTAGKDAKTGKATIASLYGLEMAKEQLHGLLAEAKKLLAPFGERANDLKAMADFIKDRSF